MQPDPAVDGAAVVGIGPLVAQGRIKLVEQIAMGTVNLHTVVSGCFRPQRSSRKISDHFLNVRYGHFFRHRVVRSGDGDLQCAGAHNVHPGNIGGGFRTCVADLGKHL